MAEVVVPPGQARLFAVEPSGTQRLLVLDVGGRVLVATGELAVAVIAAASITPCGWVVATDRWSARITLAADGSWCVAADAAAPVDAIRRVLAFIPTREEP